MERLGQRDLRALLECLREVYAIQDLDGFARHVISALPQLVPSEITSYNEVNPPQRRLALLADPPGSLEFPGKQIFEAHMAEHPLITHYHQTHDGRALKISDFLTQHQLHHLGLYNEYYRQVGVEYQVAVTLPAPQPLVIGIALNRGRRDFSERDRLCLNLLRPHLIQAYRNAEVVTQTQQELATVRQVLEELALGVIVLGRDGRVRLMTPRARQALVEYCGSPARGADRLPEDLRRWVQQQETLLAVQSDMPPPRQPLVLEREGKHLVIRLLSEPGETLLLLEEEQTAWQPTALERFGLTRWEAEVLFWVTEGKTDWAIGVILGVSVRTVQKHLEHIFSKLGVETRTAAAAWAHEMAGQGR